MWRQEKNYLKGANVGQFWSILYCFPQGLCQLLSICLFSAMCKRIRPATQSSKSPTLPQLIITTPAVTSGSWKQSRTLITWHWTLTICTVTFQQTLMEIKRHWSEPAKLKLHEETGVSDHLGTPLVFIGTVPTIFEQWLIFTYILTFNGLIISGQSWYQIKRMELYCMVSLLCSLGEHKNWQQYFQ